MEYTDKQIQDALAIIKTMAHYEMCRLWRFHPKGTDIYLRGDLPTGEAFKERLFQHFGGFTPEISKELGWEL
ncbi:MAG: hypothetical protein EOM05_11470 [Clostridia bacterium]|nr:hypothetical protein [Clostridia bacterium]